MMHNKPQSFNQPVKVNKIFQTGQEAKNIEQKTFLLKSYFLRYIDTIQKHGWRIQTVIPDK